MAATLLLTGGFHAAGRTDTCNALGGAVNRRPALPIMKNSRIGSYGALGLLIVLGLKAAALTALPLALAMPAFLLAHRASRAAVVLLIRWLPYAGGIYHAKAKPLAPGPLIATGLALVGLDTAASSRWLQRRLGSYTGDALGTMHQVTELLMVLGWLEAAQSAG